MPPPNRVPGTGTSGEAIVDILIVGGTGITRQLAARGDCVTMLNRGQTAAELPPGAAQLAPACTCPFDDRPIAAYRLLGPGLAAGLAGLDG